jgi:hypothetical protein
MMSGVWRERKFRTVVVSSGLLSLAAHAVQALPVSCAKGRSHAASSARVTLEKCTSGGERHTLRGRAMPAAGRYAAPARAARLSPAVEHVVPTTAPPSVATVDDMFIPPFFKDADLVTAASMRAPGTGAPAVSLSRSTDVFTALPVAGATATRVGPRGTLDEQKPLGSAALREPASLLCVGAGLLLAGIRIRRLPSGEGRLPVNDQPLTRVESRVSTE